jgi:hypothetical protein
MGARVFLSVFCLLLGQAPLAMANDDKWLALNRMEIMRLFRVADAKEVREGKGAPMDVHLLRGRGDTVWVGMNQNGNFRLAMAGRGDKVHSIRVFVPIVNLSDKQNDQTFQMLNSFFAAEFPDWRGAKSWSSQSMSSSWSASANAMERKPFDRNAIITKKTIDGVTISTFGVPPDIILYAATVRQSCIPKLDSPHNVRNDPVQRLVC